MTVPFLSVGHSSRSLDEFLDMLRSAGVGMVIDVRSFPKSRANPVYNTDRLPDDLAAVQIGYRHLVDLGGRRGRQAGVDPAVNALWRVASFHNYADYALGDAFGSALADLAQEGSDRTVAIMCAEAVWWRCHRRIIADHLLARGLSVAHLMAPDRIEPARLTPGARVERGRVTYPAGGGAA
jgi:uncharacterized protein (DUF488 family)